MDYSPEFVNEFASYIALAALIPAAVATGVYGLGSPWWLSWLGRTILAQWLSIVLVFGVILGRRFFGEYPGYEWVAISAYSLLFLAFTAMSVIVILERRPPAIASVRKAGTKMTTPITPGPTEPSFFATARKAFVAAGVAAVGAGGAALGAAASDGAITTTELVIVGGAVVVAAAGAFVSVYQTSNAKS